MPEDKYTALVDSEEKEDVSSRPVFLFLSLFVFSLQNFLVFCKVSLGGLGWPQSLGDPPASSSQVRGL